MAIVRWRGRIVGTTKPILQRQLEDVVGCAVMAYLEIPPDTTIHQINNMSTIDFDETFKALYLTPDTPDDYRHTASE